MSYNTELQSNNTELTNILNTVNELPMAAADDVVLFTEQTLTDAQKSQARTNIGAQATGDYALKSEIPSNLITMVGVDASGVSHTWKVYGTVV